MKNSPGMLESVDLLLHSLYCLWHFNNSFHRGDDGGDLTVVKLPNAFVPKSGMGDLKGELRYRQNCNLICHCINL